jgi:hypothetical protein
LANDHLLFLNSCFILQDNFLHLNHHFAFRLLDIFFLRHLIYLLFFFILRILLMSFICLVIDNSNRSSIVTIIGCLIICDGCIANSDITWNRRILIIGRRILLTSVASLARSVVIYITILLYCLIGWRIWW